MNIDDRERRLNDYIDGLLSPEAAREVEAELARDPEFRAEEQALRALLAEAAHLPKEIAPERDLWAGIAFQLGEQRDPRPERPRSVFSRYRYAVLAASLAAVFLAGIYFARMPYPGELNGSAGANLVALDAEYARARTVLTQALDESRDRLSPETVAVVDENLAIIADAVGEILGALEKDPGNPQLIRSLVAAYDKEVDLLKRAAQLPAQF